MPPTHNSLESMGYAEWRSHEFAQVLHWAGMALLAYFLVDLAFQAWPIALLKPLWLDQMNGFLMDRSMTPLLGALIVAAATEVDPRSTSLAKRAALLRRAASWVAIGYLLLIPVQIYAGVNILRAERQEASKLFSQATQSAQAIEASSTEAELRQAYKQIQGAKAPLPAQLPQSLSALKSRLVEAMEARSKKAQYEFDQRMSQFWQRSLELIFGNILRSLIFFVGFAAIGRPSPNQITLLSRLINRHSRSQIMLGRQVRPDKAVFIPEEWMAEDEMTTK